MAAGGGRRWRRRSELRRGGQVELAVRGRRGVVRSPGRDRREPDAIPGVGQGIARGTRRVHSRRIRVSAWKVERRGRRGRGRERRRRGRRIRQPGVLVHRRHLRRRRLERGGGHGAGAGGYARAHVPVPRSTRHGIRRGGQRRRRRRRRGTDDGAHDDSRVSERDGHSRVRRNRRGRRMRRVPVRGTRVRGRRRYRRRRVGIGRGRRILRSKNRRFGRPGISHQCITRGARPRVASARYARAVRAHEARTPAPRAAAHARCESGGTRRDEHRRGDVGVETPGGPGRRAQFLHRGARSVPDLARRGFLRSSESTDPRREERVCG